MIERLNQKYNVYSKCESAHICINVNKNIEQRLWPRFQTTLILQGVLKKSEPLEIILLL